MTDITTVLGSADTGRVAEFLLHHMSMETRHKLMSELPVAYAKLYPNVSADHLAEIVRATIKGNRAHERGLITDDERRKVLSVLTAQASGPGGSGSDRR